jgi:hypothetical protein
VSEVYVREYQERARIVDEVMAAPADARIIVGGYSCGLNSATAIARLLWERGRRVASVVGIQQSKWCGGDALEGNVTYGQSTYNADCPSTMGLGCKPLAGAPSFGGQIINIDRPDSHGAADNNPDAQADVLKAIAATAWYGAEVPAPEPPPGAHPTPPIATPPRAECSFAWSSNRGWAVLCSRPQSAIDVIARPGAGVDWR